MTTYLLGAPVPVTISVRQTGTLVDPTTINLVLHRPTASVKTYTYNPGDITRDSVGAFHVDIPASDLAEVEHYPYAWTTTGPGAGVVAGSFDIRDPFTAAVLPLQDAKDQLDIPQTTTTYDDEIQSFVDTITENMERMTGGPLLNRSITERIESGYSDTVLAVRYRPLVSVTSIVDTASGSTLSIADVELDTNAGLIRRKLGVGLLGVSCVYTVTYVAGWGTSVPASFAMAGRIILAHLWATQHGPSARPALGGLDEVTLPGWGYAIPNRAAELLSPYTLDAYV